MPRPSKAASSSRKRNVKFHTRVAHNRAPEFLETIAIGSLAGLRLFSHGAKRQAPSQTAQGWKRGFASDTPRAPGLTDARLQSARPLARGWDVEKIFGIRHRPRGHARPQGLGGAMVLARAAPRNMTSSSSAPAAMAWRPPIISPRSTASPMSRCSKRAGSAAAIPAATPPSSAPTISMTRARGIYDHALKLWDGLSQELNYNVMYSARGVMMLAHNVHDIQVLQAPRPCQSPERHRQ